VTNSPRPIPLLMRCPGGNRSRRTWQYAVEAGARNLLKFQTETLPRWRVRNNLAFAALDQLAKLIVPHRQRGAHLAFIDAAIVNACRPALMPGLMVQNLLDDVRHDAEVGQLGGDAAADIVRCPVFHTRARIQHRLAARPRGEPAPALAEELRCGAVDASDVLITSDAATDDAGTDSRPAS
jgi:hypothetical protein